MPESKRHTAVTGLRAMDLAGMVLSLAAAACVGYFESGYENFLAFADEHLRLTHVVFILAMPFIWNAVFSLFALYTKDSLFKHKGRYKEVGKATLTGTMVMLVAASLMGYRIVTPLFLVTFWVGSTAASLGARAWMRKRLFILSRDPADRRQVVIVGTNQRALELAWEMRLKPEMGFHLVGFVDDDWQIDVSDQKSMYKLVAGFDGLKDYLARERGGRGHPVPASQVHVREVLGDRGRVRGTGHPSHRVHAPVRTLQSAHAAPPVPQRPDHDGLRRLGGRP